MPVVVERDIRAIHGIESARRHIDRAAQFKADIDYFHKHRISLLKKYPEKYVAVLNNQVIGASSTPRGIAKIISKAEAPDEVVVMLVSKKKVLTLY